MLFRNHSPLSATKHPLFCQIDRVPDRKHLEHATDLSFDDVEIPFVIMLAESLERLANLSATELHDFIVAPRPTLTLNLDIPMNSSGIHAFQIPALLMRVACVRLTATRNLVRHRGAPKIFVAK